MKREKDPPITFRLKSQKDLQIRNSTEVQINLSFLSLRQDSSKSRIIISNTSFLYHFGLLVKNTFELKRTINSHSTYYNYALLDCIPAANNRSLIRLSLANEKTELYTKLELNFQNAKISKGNSIKLAESLEAFASICEMVLNKPFIYEKKAIQKAMREKVKFTNCLEFLFELEAILKISLSDDNKLWINISAEQKKEIANYYFMRKRRSLFRVQNLRRLTHGETYHATPNIQNYRDRSMQEVNESDGENDFESEENSEIPVVVNKSQNRMFQHPDSQLLGMKLKLHPGERWKLPFLNGPLIRGKSPRINTHYRVPNTNIHKLLLNVIYIYIYI